jgi:alpha-glucosidase
METIQYTSNTFEHRNTGTRGVLLPNSDGMDIKLTKDGSRASALEYNAFGGILDFFAGSETDPTRSCRLTS